jgi:hypothetical protein
MPAVTELLNFCQDRQMLQCAQGQCSKIILPWNKCVAFNVIITSNLMGMTYRTSSISNTLLGTFWFLY